MREGSGGLAVLVQRTTLQVLWRLKGACASSRLLLSEAKYLRSRLSLCAGTTAHS
jgi:hypothetical protein